MPSFGNLLDTTEKIVFKATVGVRFVPIHHLATVSSSAFFRCQYGPIGELDVQHVSKGRAPL